MIAKTGGDTSKPGEMRPIACMNAHGKVFWLIVGRRLTVFLMANEFVDGRTQKGFCPGVSGCIEHGSLIMTAFADASKSRRSIVCTWVDLANAYGSIRHSFILFALRRYGVPLMICNLICNYYDHVCAIVRTKQWQTCPFPFEIGVFQGCTLSTILFNVAYQPLLDALKGLSNLGYAFRFINANVHSVVQADDLTIMTRTPRENQAGLDRLNVALAWTKTLKAKPKKCVTLARKLIRDEEGISYKSYDPKLMLSDSKLAMLDNVRNPEKPPMRHLGHTYSEDLSTKPALDCAIKALEERLQLLDESPLGGFQKIWGYKHVIAPKLRWELLVNDFNVSEVERWLDPMVKKVLKKWAKMPKAANTSILFRRKLFGMGMMLPSAGFRTEQVGKMFTLKHAKDPRVNAVFQWHSKVESMQQRKWSKCATLEDAEKRVLLTESFPKMQHGRAGLGSQPPEKELSYRGKVLREVKGLEEDAVLRTLNNLAFQGRVAAWQEVMDGDLDWQKLTFQGAQEELSWTANAIGDTLPTNVLLRIWKATTVDKCDLCQQPNCSLLHILNSCKVALNQGRYTWRHDQVLKLIHRVVQEGMQVANNSSTTAMGKIWLRSGETAPPKDPKSRDVGHLLAGAKKWRCMFDLPDSAGVYPTVTVPGEILSSKQRPDGVVWSEQSRRIILIELTVPWEENMEAATKRKQSRYASISDMLRKRGWMVTLLTVEVGSRGFAGKSLNYLLKGFGCKWAKSTRRLIGERARHCSYVIWLSRKMQGWRTVSVEDGEE